jgi:hypothetical protein
MEEHLNVGETLLNMPYTLSKYKIKLFNLDIYY